MTNADAIRTMADKELFVFLKKFQDGDIDYAVTFCTMCENTLNLDCDGCLKDWLSMDAIKHYQGLLYPNGCNSEVRREARTADAVEEAERDQTECQ